MEPLFTVPLYRDPLVALMMAVRPPIFATLARINRYCAEIASKLRAHKQQQWVDASNPYEPVFRHNGRAHGPHVWFYPNGALHCIVPYQNGIAHGTVLNWYYIYDLRERGPHSIISCNRRVKVERLSADVLRFRFDIWPTIYCDIRCERMTDGMSERFEKQNGELTGVYEIWSQSGYLIQYKTYKKGLYHGPVVLWSYRNRLIRACYFNHMECMIHRNNAVCIMAHLLGAN